MQLLIQRGRYRAGIFSCLPCLPYHLVTKDIKCLCIISVASLLLFVKYNLYYSFGAYFSLLFYRYCNNLDDQNRDDKITRASTVYPNQQIIQMHTQSMTKQNNQTQNTINYQTPLTLPASRLYSSRALVASFWAYE